MTDDTRYLARQVGRIRDQIAAIGAARPTPEQLADEDAADEVMAQRIHDARPGVPLHHVFAVLQALRAVHEMDPPEPTEAERDRLRSLLAEVLGQFQPLRHEHDPTGEPIRWQCRVLPYEYEKWRGGGAGAGDQAAGARERA